MIAAFHDAPAQDHGAHEEAAIDQGKSGDNSKWEAPVAKKDDNADAWAVHPAPQNAEEPEPPQEQAKKITEVSFAAQAP